MMKWKRYTESIDPDVPYIPSEFILHDIDEITPEHYNGSNMGSAAAFMIQQYINDIAKNYRHGVIPEDEEEELRNCLMAIYVEFEYWHEEDEYPEGYEDGQIIFLIDTSDNTIIDSDTFSEDIPDDVFELAKKEALKYIKSHN